jgi:hypothetical protein
MYQFGLVLIAVLLGTITTVYLIHMYGYLGVACTNWIVGFMGWIVWEESQYTTNTIAMKARHHTTQTSTRMGLLRVGGPCRIMVLLLGFTITICTLIVVSTIGVRVYNEYEYRRNQEPVGYDANWFRD